MRIGILGRTRDLINTANLLYKKGYEIPFIWTCKTENIINVMKMNLKN